MMENKEELTAIHDFLASVEKKNIEACCLLCCYGGGNEEDILKQPERLKRGGSMGLDEDGATRPQTYNIFLSR